MELASKRFADTVALFATGRIDHATAEPFKAAMAPHLATCAAGRDRLVLDLGGVEYISSVGLRVLMLASKQPKAQYPGPCNTGRAIRDYAPNTRPTKPLPPTPARVRPD